MIVINKELFASVKFPSITAWWAHVTLTPEEIKIKVLSNGTPKGLNTAMPLGGHLLPNSTFTLKLLWKNAQKKERKKKTSEVINKTIPHRSPNSTTLVWRPWNLPSRDTSRHHWYMTNNNINKPNIINNEDCVWNHFTKPKVIPAPEILAIRGHGDSSTKWYGCEIIFDIYIYVIC